MIKLREWMKDKNVSKTCKELGISRPTLYAYFKDESSPSLEVAMKLRVLTGLKFSELLARGSKKSWDAWLDEYTKEDNL